MVCGVIVESKIVFFLTYTLKDTHNQDLTQGGGMLFQTVMISMGGII